MDVRLDIEKHRILIELIPTNQEIESEFGNRLAEILKFTIASTGLANFKKTHPDHLALIILLAAHPFSIGELNIPLEVSNAFSDACKIFSRYKPVFLSNRIQEYSAGPNGRPGLAYSGGVDSTAALELMPPETLPIFLDRPINEKKSMYNKSAARATLSFLEAIGIPNASIPTDVEYIRNPIGFPTDIAAGIPVIALASHLNIDSVGFGTVMESAYRIGHEKSRDYATSQHFTIWNRIFTAAGLPLFLPVAGVSEIGTSKIVHDSKFRGIARSCIRGDWPNPCNMCWKCFRKQLIENRLNNVSSIDDAFHRILNSKEVVMKVSQHFIAHENVIAWALGNMERGPVMDALYSRLVGSTYDVQHLLSYYSPAIELVPSKYRLGITNNLNKYLQPMTEEIQKKIINLNFEEYIQSQAYHDKINHFLSLLKL
jgi:hypothetical protein